MTHNQRGRLTVDLGGNWRIWTNTIPSSGQVLGTVCRNGWFSNSGAIVLFEATGIYMQVNAGVVSSLPQAKVRSAIAKG